jgi:hypothetical protein
MSARADTGQQLDVDACIASARADSTAEALALVAEARDQLRAAELERQLRWDQLCQEIVAAQRAGASVRALGRAAGMGKTQAANIARFGEAGWR